MPQLEPVSLAALSAALLLTLTLVVMRLRMPARRRRPAHDEAVDTLAGWAPEAARVMTASERQAYEVLRQALPGHMVLAQVPLSRFLRVPTNRSYSQWLQRVGGASADLLVCDAGSRVLAAVDIRTPGESARSRERHERMTRVLKAAGIAVLKWHAERLPSASEVRTMMIPVLEAQHPRKDASSRAGTPSRPLPLIPVAEMEELLAAGDAQSWDAEMEPVPSALFDDFEPEPRAALAR